MTVSVQQPVAFRSGQSKQVEPTQKLDLDKIINLSFMSLVEAPDLSCVYRVRSGDNARSIVTMALKKRLNREPNATEIESYLLEVRDLNDKIDGLQPGDIFNLPIDHEHALSHHIEERPAAPLRFIDRTNILRSAPVVRSTPEHVHSPAQTKRPANVRIVIAPPGLEPNPGACILVDDGIIRSRNASAPELDEESSAITYTYTGELSSSFLGLFRSFFVAHETRSRDGELLCSDIEYDGFGTSIKFMTIVGVVEFSLVRTIKTRFDEATGLFETVVTCADDVVHTMATSQDGSRCWRV
ncbi:MAG TPA: hypothetical protein V6C76_18035 [Drouetiella sp.]